MFMNDECLNVLDSPLNFISYKKSLNNINLIIEYEKNKEKAEQYRKIKTFSWQHRR